jgi:hypothetical protein
MCRLVPVIFFISFFISCSNKNKVPDEVLPASEMEKVMWDMFRADEFVTSFVWKNDSGINRLDTSLRLYEEIFRIHDITKEKFEKSLSFYRTHPDLLKSIVDSLSLQEHPQKKRPPVAIETDTTTLKLETRPIQ